MLRQELVDRGVFFQFRTPAGAIWKLRVAWGVNSFVTIHGLVLEKPSQLGSGVNISNFAFLNFWMIPYYFDISKRSLSNLKRVLKRLITWRKNAAKMNTLMDSWLFDWGIFMWLVLFIRDVHDKSWFWPKKYWQCPKNFF